MTLPFISVIMPVRNEGAFLRRSLGCVLAQDYPAERMEIIVADGMSTDHTREILQELQSQHAYLRVVDNPGKIVPTGMNIALAQAKGEIIVRVDGHCEIEPNYCTRCVEHLQNPEIDGVGGPVITLGDNDIAHAISIAMSSGFGVGGSAFRTIMNNDTPNNPAADITLLSDTIPFPAYRRSTIDRAGPYDEELVRNQDDEYNYRLRKLGAKLLLATNVRSLYFSRSTLYSLWRQYFQYGYWKVRVMQKHPLQMRLRQFAPAAFILAIITSLAIAPFSMLGVGAFCFLISLYILGNVLGTVTNMKRGENWRVVALLPVCFAILHFSYGSGFLLGLVRFCHRWGDRSTRAKALPIPVSPG